MKKCIFLIALMLIVTGCSNDVSSTPTATPYQIFDITDTAQDINCSNETHLVQYEVMGTADGIAYIQFYNESYARIYDWDVTLPWSYSFCAPSGNYLWIQVHTESANVSVTGKIFFDGELLQMGEECFEEPDAFLHVDGWIP